MRLPTFPITRIILDSVGQNACWGWEKELASKVKLEKACRRCRRIRQGAAAVEFAIVAPLFFLMVFGMIEFGRAIMVQQVLTNATREGARYAVVDGSTSALAAETVTTYLRSAGIASGETIVVGEASATNPPVITAKEPNLIGFNGLVGVKASVDYSDVTWLPAPWFLAGRTLSATTVMRRETVQSTN
jgi:Flp pilus assembly protein TadG